MSAVRTDDLVELLAAGGEPVAPLTPPLKRAFATLAAIGAAGALAIALFADVPATMARHAGRETLMALEMAAMLATAILAVAGAFSLSIPGRSKRWLLAPIPPFIAWVGLSGLGCYQDFVRNSAAGWALGHSLDCLAFILATSVVVGAPLAWRLSRARPVDPLPVALLGGLGTAALAALLLQFFHPFTVTFLDLAVHLLAVLLVVAMLAVLNRRALAPA